MANIKHTTSTLLIILGVIVAGFVLLKNNSQDNLTADDMQSADDGQIIATNNLETPLLLEQRDEQLIEHLAYTISYNPTWNIPNWVAYCLTDEELSGNEPRSEHFYPDPLVKGDPVVTKDYSNSGYDRGHMAPAADFKWSSQAMQECFYMTNMCPQNHNLNTGDWNDLEEKVRRLAATYKEVYICCGPIVDENPETIGYYHNVVVPKAFYKALLFKKNGQWVALGFFFANQPKNGKHGLEYYQMTIDELETVTHIDFFSALPDEVENNIENVLLNINKL